MSLTDQIALREQVLDTATPEEQFAREWQRAHSNDLAARSQWRSHGGQWVWGEDGVVVTSSGGEWSKLSCEAFNGEQSRGLRNFVIEVTVSGKAEAAGLSFGDFKDFLAGLGSGTEKRRLQLEIDVNAGCWAFRIDGQLQHRAWWDSAVHSANDLLNGTLNFKARRVEEVRFEGLAVHSFQSSCQLSVIITCYRFVQRLRVTLRNWCHQSLPHGAYEVLVVNPASPDGTHEYLAAVAASYPHVRVRELAVDAKSATNKAAMINRAFQASHGEWIWLTDSDCLFSPTAAEKTLERIKGQNSRLFYGQRYHLAANQTSELLAGRSDGLRDFEVVCRCVGPRAPDNEPWGYTQILHRSMFERVPYREQVNHFAHSDSLFIQDCRQRRILPAPVEGLFCLHLDHPFAWYGTNAFL